MTYRQGDISLHQINSLPEGVKKAKNNILAYGEVTGHQHRLNSQQICVFEKDNSKFVKLGSECELVHDFANGNGVVELEVAEREDKHLILIIDEGMYEVKNEREFDVFTQEIRQVLD